MLPIVGSFTRKNSIRDISKFFDTILFELDPSMDHRFDGFFAFDLETIEKEVLPLIGTPLGFTLKNRALYFLRGVVTQFGHMQFYNELVDHQVLASNVTEMYSTLTIGLYVYTGPYSQGIT